MERCLEPEWLDALPPEDPLAVQSRQDLLRVNGWMGHGEIMAQALRSTCAGAPASDPARRTLHSCTRLETGAPAGRGLVDLGAGDGRFLLLVARRLGADWRGTTAVLLDRRKAMSPETQHAFADLGWRTAVLETEVQNWLRSAAAKGSARSTSGVAAGVSIPLGGDGSGPSRRGGDTAPCLPLGFSPAPAAWDTMVTNLFLHHFPSAQLAELLSVAASFTRLFVAVEPRRSARSLFFSRLLGLIGCNRVTQHDAPVSVRAGFAGQELSQLWPAGPGWSLLERPAGWFSHLFIARRMD